MKQIKIIFLEDESPTLIRRDDLSAMPETIVTEISVENETCFFTWFYRLPSQSHDKLENFCSELNLLLTNINNNQPTCSILISDFNAKCSADGVAVIKILYQVLRLIILQERRATVN